MAQHPRTRIVSEAQYQIASALSEISERHGLTFVELVRILGDEIGRLAKYALRAERHPNSPDTPADVADEEG